MPFSSARVLGEIASNIVTWKQYGAKGDGVADDTEAINAAMLAADVARDLGVPTVVLAGVGDYVITSPINIYDGTRLYGLGIGVTNVFCERCNGIELADSADADAGYTNDWEVRGLSIVGDDDIAEDNGDHIGLWCRRANRWLCHRVEVKGFTTCVAVDGRTNSAGNFGAADGRFLDCEFETRNGNQQRNPHNAYPGNLVEFLADENGNGGADGVSFYNCRIYAEILVDSAMAAGDGATTSFQPFGGLVASKTVTADAHVEVRHKAAAGPGSGAPLTVGVHYTIDRATDPNDPSFDFSAGSSPLGAPAAVALLATTGDGTTKAFRLTHRATYAAAAGGRAAGATVGGAAQTGGTDFYVVDGENKSYGFAPSAVDVGTDAILLTAAQMADLASDNGIGDGTGRIVRFASTGTLPTGLSAATDYYATAIDVGAGAFKVAATYANAVAGTPTVVNLTGAGSGAHSVSIENAIEFASAPGAAVAVAVNDANLRFRWIDPNAQACVKLCRGASRIGFFSCLIGGGLYGVDFNHARRCVLADPYFQICGYAVNFEADANQNTILGFAARTDSTILYDFARDMSVAENNAYDEFLAKGTTVRNEMLIKETFTEADAEAGRLSKTAGELLLEALDAADSVGLAIDGVKRLFVSGSGARMEYRDSAGNEVFRWAEAGAFTPRLGSGTQDLGGNLNSWNRTYTKEVRLGADDVTIRTGAGSPEGAVSGQVGDLYLRTDGGGSTTLYVKESGAGDTGWAAK